MQENETEEIVLEETEEETEETQPKETPEAKLARLKRQAAQLEKKLGVQPEAEKKEDKSTLDRFDKLFLRQEGIKSEAEMKLVEQIKKETGKQVEDILDSKYFKAELQALREDAATKESTPSATKRSNQSPRNEVDYWLAKGELPKDNPELARKVVNAKMEKLKNTNMFTDTPVIS
jgi:hypothetical protein